MICNICQDTIQRAITSLHSAWRSKGKEIYDPKHRHHRSLKSLQESLLASCRICSLFWNNISGWGQTLILTRLQTRSALVTEIEVLPYERDEGDERWAKNFWFNIRLEEDHINYRWPVEDEQGQEIALRMVLDGFPPKYARSLESNTRSPEAFSLARTWISDCMDKHEKCKNTPPECRWFPTRLLDLDSDQLSSGSICLIETSSTKPVGPYMTLSHCWGALQHFKLTKSTHSALVKGIPISSLRQLFQDVIHAVRRLGTRYLWIDALCIFQDEDDLSDWNREAPRMQEVYVNSICNISALDARDGSYSLFSSRDTEIMCPIVVNVNAQDGDSEEAASKPFVLHHHPFWRRQVDEAVINTRAWVVQERMLASRVLHFGRQQLFWECAEKKAAEIYPDGLPTCIPHRTDQMISSGLGIGGPPETSPYHSWCEIVGTYTKCKLTKSQDKLIACSGLAKRVAALMKDEYVAGLWRRQLECQLLWRIAGDPLARPNVGDTSRPDVYRAPSWSWASVDGQIELPYSLGGTSLATVEHIRLEHATGDPFGVIRTAQLRIKGVLRAITIHEPYYPPGSQVGTTWLVRLRDADAAHQEANSTPQFKLDIMQSNFQKENSEGSLYMMPMTLSEFPGRGAPSRTIEIGALLLRVVDLEKGVYHRIGVATWAPRDEAQEKWISGPCDAKVGAKFPCVSYGEGWHSVIIE